jgi:hypothetical protein
MRGVGVSVSELNVGIWRKSSHSGGGNDCVEIATSDTTTAVRDSKNPDGPRLSFGPGNWTAFLDTARTNPS